MSATAVLDLLRSGRPAEAEALLRDAPQDVRTLHLRAIAAHQLRRPQDAEALIAAAVRLADSPELLASLHNDLGNIRLESGDPAAAVEAYESSLRVQPADAPTLVNLATALRLSGEPDRSAQAGLRALQLDPSSAPARAAVWTAVQQLVSRGATDRALQVMWRWHRIDPGHSGVRHRLAALGGLPDLGRAPADYVESLFDGVAGEFDPHLASLGYRAPGLVADAVRSALGATAVDRAADRVAADAGCGTGLVGELVRPWAGRLLGCDLSLGMLEMAQRRGCYDELFKADLVDFLAAQPAAFDLVTCADTLCYLGDLSAFALAAGTALRPGGVVVATVERLDAGDWALSPTGRYQHSEAHLRDACATAGLQDLAMREEVLRTEAAAPVRGIVWTARRGC